MAFITGFGMRAAPALFKCVLKLQPGVSILNFATSSLVKYMMIKLDL